MRLLGLLLTALLLGGCAGGQDAGETGDAGSTPPAPEPTTAEPTTGTEPSPRPGSGPAVQPPRDTEGVVRTGALPLAYCPDGAPAYSFDGTVVAVDGEVATFEVNEVFLGDLGATTEVRLGEPVTAGHSEASPSWSVGTRLLVQGAGGRAWGCGDTVYHDESTAAEWRS